MNKAKHLKLRPVQSRDNTFRMGMCECSRKVHTRGTVKLVEGTHYKRVDWLMPAKAVQGTHLSSGCLSVVIEMAYKPETGLELALALALALALLWPSPLTVAMPSPLSLVLSGAVFTIF